MQTHTQENKGRLRSAWEFAKFFHLTFIAPWPPIAFLLLGTAVAGAASPIIIVYVTRRLIDDLTAGIGEGSPSMLDALAPHAPWLGLLVFIRLVDHYSQMGPLHYYLGYLLNDRSRRKFDPMFFRGALTMRLEWFEYPSTTTPSNGAVSRWRTSTSRGRFATRSSSLRRAFPSWG